ncbi:hypothetical protein AKO1_007374, partial [Acrasis kona]
MIQRSIAASPRNTKLAPLPIDVSMNESYVIDDEFLTPISPKSELYPTHKNLASNIVHEDKIIKKSPRLLPLESSKSNQNHFKSSVQEQSSLTIKNDHHHVIKNDASKNQSKTNSKESLVVAPNIRPAWIDESVDYEAHSESVLIVDDSESRNDAFMFSALDPHSESIVVRDEPYLSATDLEKLYLSTCDRRRCSPNSKILDQIKSDQFCVGRTVDLSDNYLGGGGVECMLELLEFVNCNRLNLRHNGINNKCAARLADVIQRHPNITSLILSNNEITLSGAIHLVKMIKKNQNIRELDLRGCRIDEKYLKKMEELVR